MENTKGYRIEIATVFRIPGFWALELNENEKYDQRAQKHNNIGYDENYKIYLMQKLKEQRSSANHITEQVRAIMSR